MDLILTIHLLAVVFWIGGVGFATIVVFPTIGRLEDSMEKVKVFLGIERRFARLARIYVAVVGITGLLLFLRMGGLEWAFANPVPHAILAFKVIVWLAFFMLLFGAEKRIMSKLASPDTSTDTAFKRLEVFHYFMLALTIIAIIFGEML